MNTPCIAPCVAIPLHRPWWQRLMDHWSEAAPRRADLRDPATWRRQEWLTLRGLNDRTLRDIGAPEWVHVERDARQRLGLDLMRL